MLWRAERGRLFFGLWLDLVPIKQQHVVAVSTGVRLKIPLMLGMSRIVNVGVMDLRNDTRTCIPSDLAISDGLVDLLGYLLRSFLLLRRVCEHY